EAQHMDDYMRFPGLPSKDLEYRAKLVELIYHPNLKLYNKFVQSAKDDPSLPHAYAQYVIHKEMSKQSTLSSLDIQKTAQKLFDEHTKQLLEIEGNYTLDII